MKSFNDFKKNVEEINEGHHVDISEMTDTMLLRHGMLQELEAIILYEKMAEAAQDPRVRELILDIAHEEKVHAEEFEEALEELDDDYEDAEEQAEEEVEKFFPDDEEDEEDEEDEDDEEDDDDEDEDEEPYRMY